MSSQRESIDEFSTGYHGVGKWVTGVYPQTGVPENLSTTQKAVALHSSRETTNGGSIITSEIDSEGTWYRIRRR